MSHYEERLERDLSQIKQQVALLAGLVEKALDDAMHALLADDDPLAYATILADNRINAVSNELDHMRMAFIGVHMPTGSHLRLMAAVVHANVALERIGDYAVTICREAVQTPRPPGRLERGIELIGERIAADAEAGRRCLCRWQCREGEGDDGHRRPGRADLRHVLR